jgi:hypothetical protein
MPLKQVFISHVYEERHVALVLQKYIKRAFREAFPVFAAFDKESIGGGKKWFTHITEYLTTADIVLVLISHASRRRPWISFEAGFGDGVGADVIPVSIRGFSLGRLEFPLAGYQGRSIDDLPSLLADITNRVGSPSERQDLEENLKEIRAAETQMAHKSLEVRPFVRDGALQFELTNKGNTDIELLMLEALVPLPYARQVSTSEFMHRETKQRGDQVYVWVACTSQRGAFGARTASLRPIITPAMGVVPVPEMYVRLDPPSLEADLARSLPIYYQAHAVDYPTEMEQIIWAQLEFR